jgi:amino acid transporter
MHAQDGTAPIPDVTSAAPAGAVVRLRRDALGLRATIASTLANLAPGMTIFLGITVVVAGMGSRAPWAFALAAVAVLASGNTMAQFAKVLPSAGSFVTFISNGFGVTSRRAGTVLGGVAFYLLLLSFPITQAAVVVFLGAWVVTLFHWTAPDAWLLVTLGAVAAVTPLLLRGVAISTLVSSVLFAVDAVGLVLLSVGVLLLAHTHRDAPLHDIGGAPGGFGGLAGLPFALAVFGYIGWENAGPLAEESTHPRRSIPLTIFASVLTIGVLYVLSTWAAVVGFAAWHGPARGLTLLGSVQETAPFLDLARHQLPWCAWLIGLAGFTSPLGCFLAEVTSQARIILVVAQQSHRHLLP